MKGIDYGTGLANIDRETGIRYGVISIHSLADWVIDEAESIWGPMMGYCETHGEYPAPEDCSEDDKAPCPHCDTVSRVSSGEEPIGWNYTSRDSAYVTEQCLDSDVMLLRSPYFTHAPYCSPCVPGAGNLDGAAQADPTFPRAYCFGHEFFGSGIAPYPVYSVETGSPVQPE